MADPTRSEINVKDKTAVLVTVLLQDMRDREEHPLDELRGLAKTAGVRVVGTLVQNRNHLDAKTYLGKGKIEELKHLVQTTGAQQIIFDTSLTPAQLRNLEEELGKEIVDRSELILSIFSTAAQTYEARLQVELAQLLYMRPRLKRLWGHLERTEGAVGSRGPGEQQLETDRRLLDARVSELKQKLKVVEKRRERQVSQRKDHITVSIVGYTNAGKSTLMNALTGAEVFVANQLFATLDTRTRTWQLPHWGRVLLSDTVGFIRDLPHNLVASFRSTLEEARHADLLLHVVDSSHPNAEQQIQTVNEVLQEIGIDGSEAILVLNKTDLVEDRSLLDVLRARHPQAISVSALNRSGFQQLAQTVADRLSDGYVDARVETSAGNGRLFAFLAAHAEVKHKEFHDSRVTLTCRIPQRFMPNVPDDPDTSLQVLSGRPGANGHDVGQYTTAVRTDASP